MGDPMLHTEQKPTKQNNTAAKRHSTLFENGTFGSLLLVSHVLLLCAADWEGPPPPRGCEVFVGKIPRDMYEDELVPLFERAGKLYEFRLMMEFSGENRGYAFVMYTNK